MGRKILSKLSKLQIFCGLTGSLLILCLAASAYIIGFRTDHDKILAEMLSRAADAQNKGDKARAEKEYQLAVAETSHCSEKLKLPLVLSQLADLYVSDKKLSAAEDCLRRAIPAYKSILGTSSDGTPFSQIQVRRDYAHVAERLADVLFDQGKFSQAEPFYKTAIEENTSDAGSFETFEKLKRSYANCLRKVGKNSAADTAETDIDSDFISSPGWARTQDEAVRLFESGKFAEADRQFKSTYIAASRQAPWKVSVSLLWRGISLLSKGDSVSAETELQRSVKAMPSSEKRTTKIRSKADAWAFLAYAQTLNGKPQDSVKSYRQSVALYPGVMADFDILNHAYAQLSKPEAQKHLLAWILDSGTTGSGVKGFDLFLAVETSGIACMKRGDYASAQALLLRANKLVPEARKQQQFYKYGDAFAVDLITLVPAMLEHKHYEIGELACKNVLEVAASPQVKFQGLFNSGQLLTAQGQISAASAEFHKALELAEKQHSNLNQGLALANLAGCEFSLKHGQQLEKLYKRAVAVTANQNDCKELHVRCLLTLGCIQHDQNHDSEAESNLNHAIGLKESSRLYAQLAMALIALAEIEGKHKHYQQAVVLCKKAVSVTENRAEYLDVQWSAHARLGQYQNELGQFDDAATSLSQALAIAERLHRNDLLLATLDLLAVNKLDAGQFAEYESVYIRRINASAPKKDLPLLMGQAYLAIVAAIEQKSHHPQDPALTSHLNDMYTKATSLLTQAGPNGLYYLGGDLVRRKRYGEAERLFNQILKEPRDRIEPNNLAHTFYFLGELQVVKKQYHYAEMFYKRGVAVSAAIRADRRLALVLTMNLAHLGDVSAKQNRFYEATAWYQKAADVARNDPASQDWYAGEHVCLADVLYKQKKYLEAETMAKKAIALSERVHRTDMIVKAIIILGETEHDRGNDSEASATFNRLATLPLPDGDFSPLTKIIADAGAQYRRKKEYRLADILSKIAAALNEKAKSKG